MYMVLKVMGVLICNRFFGFLWSWDIDNFVFFKFVKICIDFL